jgi:glycosyltransferase involved in cell wall biosynthesis
LKRLIVSVTNDLSSDQRVHKICTTLQGMGFDVLLIGRHLKDSKPLERSYHTKRMKLWFTKGFLFYANYNLALFFKLLFLKKDVLLANDLDTLLPNFLISRLFNRPLVYDSHELFTEVPELVNRPFQKNIWLGIEKFIFPKLKYIYTVNHSIATIYSKKYNVPIKVIRNIAPAFTDNVPDDTFLEKVKGTKKMLILQGSGINIDRGGEEAVKMMSYLDNCILYIIGGGDIFKSLKKMVIDMALSEKVVIKDKIPYQKLMAYTQAADLGLSLDKGTNLNYEYSLPNKVFDYIQAQTPLLVSNRKEVAALVTDNNIGAIAESLNPKELATQIMSILSNKTLLKTWRRNLKTAAKIYTWENESRKLETIFKDLI